jgi:hypothetical protein
MKKECSWKELLQDKRCNFESTLSGTSLLARAAQNKVLKFPAAPNVSTNNRAAKRNLVAELSTLRSMETTWSTTRLSHSLLSKREKAQPVVEGAEIGTAYSPTETQRHFLGHHRREFLKRGRNGE